MSGLCGLQKVLNALLVGMILNSASGSGGQAAAPLSTVMNSRRRMDRLIDHTVT